MKSQILSPFRILPVAMALALVVLLVLLTVSSVRNVRHVEERMTIYLESEADLVIQALEAGVRAGMLSPVWDVQDVQQHLLEFAQMPDVAFLAIADSKGNALFHSDADMVGKPLPGFEAPNAARPTSGTEPELANLLIRSGPFAPLREVEDWDSPKGRLLLQRWFVWAQRLDHVDVSADDLSDLRVYVGLEMERFRVEQEEEKRDAIISTIVLFLAGGVCIWLLLFYHGARTIRHAYRELRGTTDIILQNLPTGLVTTDAQGIITRFNPEAERILGLERPCAEGEPLRSVLPDAADPTERVMAGEIPGFESRFEHSALPGTPAKLVSMTIVPLRNHMGRRKGALLNLRDMTELEKLERQVRRSENLVALGRFAAGVAHEIRNPLSSIRGLAQYLAGRHKNDPDDAESFRIIDQEVERLNRKLTELLSFARHDLPPEGTVEIGKALRRVADLIEPDIVSRKIQFETDIPDDLGELRGDADRLHQAFLNVLLNAVDAAGEGGQITLRAYKHNGNGVCVEIADDGPGIDREDMERVFEPFFSTKCDGLGLGLALTHRIAVDHGGTIDINSACGQGAAVVFTFPTEGIES